MTDSSVAIVHILIIFTFQLFHRKQTSSTAFLSEVVSVINWTKVIDGSSSHQELVSVHVTLFHLLVSLASNQDVSQVKDKLLLYLL